MRKSTKDTLVIGFALFSMFFGAGNLIFPPYLGLESGSDWLLGFVCYYIADVGLALLGLFAILKCGNSEGLTSGLGKIPATIMLSVITLCIGPMVAIPRTAATTFEMSVRPMLGGASPVVFSILFFALILVLCLRESAVVDIVGKFLTPGLLIGLLILIIKGTLFPIGSVADIPLIDDVAAQGIKAGYQTLDVLAVMIFGVLILKTADEKGYTERRDKSKIVAWSGLVAGAALFVAYIGLTYLGATASTFFGTEINRSELVVAIVESILGKWGVGIFAIVVALACITTALALVSSSADYFAGLFNGRVSYKAMVFIICIASAVISNVGLEEIVAVASPVLDIVYPPVLVLILLNFIFKGAPSAALLYSSVAGALISSVLITAGNLGLPLAFLETLPFYSLGFGWVLPTAVFAVAGTASNRVAAALSEKYA